MENNDRLALFARARRFKYQYKNLWATYDYSPELAHIFLFVDGTDRVASFCGLSYEDDGENFTESLIGEAEHCPDCEIYYIMFELWR